METASDNISLSVPVTNEEIEENGKVNECEVKGSLKVPEKKVIPEVFKKPQLIIGPRRGKAVGKIRNLTNEPSKESSESEDQGTTSDISISSDEDVESDSISCAIKNTEIKPVSCVSPAQKIKENSIPLPYKEPKWGGIPKLEYGFEVLKNGQILEKCVLEKSFYVFGRLSTCDFHMQHPTISRYHAVLQYRCQESEDSPKGFYIYDLGSTHGTFLNKNRIKPNTYVRIQVGHLLKLGCSTRLFVLWGPEEDMEEESELTVTELKEKRQLELAARELEELEKKRLEEERAKLEEEQGIDWGMGDDAEEEEADLAENPFAATQNEELYVDDPKKTLRGWFEREGYELEYDVEEKGYGQFLCRVELPIENARGGTVVAEALIKGKKKESVVQCALEACRILDRYGLLRQATHESKKRKAKDWEADDFYDSDEDTFLDRTGTVEMKRQQRMRAAGKKDPEEVVETYDSLMKKHSDVLSQLQELEMEHHKVSMDINRATKKQEDTEEEEDALDAFMMNLSKPPPDKTLLNKIKAQLAILKQEEIRLRKLVNIAKPANLPELKPPDKTILPATASTAKKALPIVGSRRKPSNKPKQTSNLEKPSTAKEDAMEVEEEEEEEEEDDDDHIEDMQKNKTLDLDKETESNIKDKAEIIQIPSEDGSAKSQSLRCTKPKIIGPAMPPPEINREVEESENNVSKKDEKRRNRNKHRKQQKNEKINENKSDYDPLDPDYSTWVPPEGQTGDGKTKLNEKYGY